MSDRIIIKKVKGHGGHHGGAWKVAYADFVTAMMSLFIVLWLMNSSPQVRQAISGYFQDPAGASNTIVGSGGSASPDILPMSRESMSRLKSQLEQAIRKVPNFERFSKQIEMTVTSEGLRIDMLEAEKGTFFELGSPVPNQAGVELLTALGAEIGKVPNHVSIEGHTDSRPYEGKGYSNWELSVDRANAARKIMTTAGLGEVQIAQVRGYADRRPRYPDDPENAGNRRISIIVQYKETERPAPIGSGGLPAQTTAERSTPSAEPRPEPQTSGTQTSGR